MKCTCIFSDVYVYNIVNDTWTSIPALISPKNSMLTYFVIFLIVHLHSHFPHHRSVASDYTRYVYLLGGTTCEGGYLAGVEIYDMSHFHKAAVRFPMALCTGVYNVHVTLLCLL